MKMEYGAALGEHNDKTIENCIKPYDMDGHSKWVLVAHKWGRCGPPCAAGCQKEYRSSCPPFKWACIAMNNVKDTIGNIWSWNLSHWGLNGWLIGSLMKLFGCLRFFEGKDKRDIHNIITDIQETFYDWAMGNIMFMRKSAQVFIVGWDDLVFSLCSS